MRLSSAEKRVLDKLQAVLRVQPGSKLDLQHLADIYINLLRSLLGTEGTYLNYLTEDSVHEHLQWFEGAPKVSAKALSATLSSYVDAHPLLTRPLTNWMKFMPHRRRLVAFVSDLGCDGFGVAFMLYAALNNVPGDTPTEIVQDIEATLGKLQYVIEERLRSDSTAPFGHIATAPSTIPFQSPSRFGLAARNAIPRSISSRSHAEENDGFQSPELGGRNTARTTASTKRTRDPSPVPLPRSTRSTRKSSSYSNNNRSSLALFTRAPRLSPANSTPSKINRSRVPGHVVRTPSSKVVEQTEETSRRCESDDDWSEESSLEDDDSDEEEEESSTQVKKKRKFATDEERLEARIKRDLAELDQLEEYWTKGDEERDLLESLRDFAEMYYQPTKVGYPKKKRPGFFCYFFNQKRNFMNLPKLGADNDVYDFVLSFKEWLFAIAPPSCVAGRTEFRDGPYRPLTRVPADQGTEADEDAWATLFNGGRNGAPLLCICLAIWKGNGEELYGTARDYANVLSDIKWIFDEGIRISSNQTGGR